MSYVYDYPHMAVTVDLVVLDRSARGRRVLLIRRARPPFEGRWALPGGFVDMDERVEDAARRELMEETGVAAGGLRFLGYFDAIGRDPRERTVSFAFAAEIDPAAAGVRAGDDAAAADWHDVDKLPPLAFDHAEILAKALRPA